MDRPFLRGYGSDMYIYAVREVVMKKTWLSFFSVLTVGLMASTAHVQAETEIVKPDWAFEDDFEGVEDTKTKGQTVFPDASFQGAA